jgi:hypothetical protein
MIQISTIIRISGNRVLATTTALLLGAAAMSMPGVIFADSIFPLQAGHDMATASMGRVLAERGWNVTREDDGSILLYPQQGNLEPHGWGVERDFDGNVLLFPGAVEVQTVAAAPSSISSQPDITNQVDLTVLRDRLSPHGWGVEQDLDGSVLLTPGAVEVQAVVVAPSTSPQPEIPGQMDLAWLRDRLSPHGWGVERDTDGSVLLIPGAVAVQTVAVTPSASPLADAGST